MRMKTLLLGTVFAVGATAMAAPADAQNQFRWARQGDALTLDPMSQNEGPTNTLSAQIYEPLIERANDLGLQAGLAVSWEPVEDTIWEFQLREGVTFHDGAAFDADDAVFSVNRAMAETSDFRNYLSSVEEVEKVDDFTIRIHTAGPNPILPQQMTFIYMMDQDWAVANNVEEPQDYAGGEETFAVRNANGTGPFIVELREPEVRTVLVKNENYWDAANVPLEIDEMVLSPIASDPTRVAALLSGELEFVLDPPVQDLQRLAADPSIKVETVDENRVIFFGMNMGAEDLDDDSVEGANPFADIQVREALYRAIDIDAIQRVVMRGQATPAGVVVPTFVHGYDADLDVRLPFDPDGARELLAEAGYPDGFQATLYCPNDRYVNDEAICQAAVGMWAQIGVEVDLVARTRSIHFQDLQNRVINFYMLGWGVPTFDSEYIFNFLYHTDDGDRGSWNGTGFSDARMDELTQAMLTEVDLAARDSLIAEAWGVAQENLVYLPLHYQVINWAMGADVNVPIRSDNTPLFKYVSFE